MVKIFKTIGAIMLIIIGLFVIYICEESIRLKHSDSALPLIITDRTKSCVECINVGEEVTIEYFSIGYSVSIRYTKSEKSHDDLAFINIIGKDFFLFNKFRLWAWIS